MNRTVLIISLSFSLSPGILLSWQSNSLYSVSRRGGLSIHRYQPNCNLFTRRIFSWITNGALCFSLCFFVFCGYGSNGGPPCHYVREQKYSQKHNRLRGNLSKGKGIRARECARERGVRRGSLPSFRAPFALLTRRKSPSLPPLNPLPPPPCPRTSATQTKLQRMCRKITLKGVVKNLISDFSSIPF